MRHQARQVAAYRLLGGQGRRGRDAATAAALVADVS